MGEFAGNVMGTQENPVVTASQGEFFIPGEKTWSSENKKWMWIAIDAAVIIGFLLLVVILAL